MNDFAQKSDDFIKKPNKKLITINEYDRVTLKISSLQLKLYLPYLKKVYWVLPDQNPQYVRLLRKEGKKVSIKKGIYQMLISKHNLSNKSKLKVINRIFDLEYKTSTLYEELKTRFINGAAPTQKG